MTPLARVREPFGDSLSPGLVEQQVLLCAAQKEVLRRHGVLSLDRMLELDAGYAKRNLFRHSGIGGDTLIQRLDLIAIRERPTASRRISS